MWPSKINLYILNHINTIEVYRSTTSNTVSEYVKYSPEMNTQNEGEEYTEYKDLVNVPNLEHEVPEYHKELETLIMQTPEFRFLRVEKKNQVYDSDDYTDRYKRHIHVTSDTQTSFPSKTLDFGEGESKDMNYLSENIESFGQLDVGDWSLLRSVYLRRYKKSIPDKNIPYWRLRFLEKRILKIIKDKNTEYSEKIKDEMEEVLKAMFSKNIPLKLLAVEKYISSANIITLKTGFPNSKPEDATFFKDQISKMYLILLDKKKLFDEEKKEFSDRVENIGEELVFKEYIKKTRKTLKTGNVLKDILRKMEFYTNLLRNRVAEKLGIKTEEFKYMFDKLYNKTIEEDELVSKILESKEKTDRINILTHYLDLVFMTKKHVLPLIDKYKGKFYYEYSNDITDFIDHESAVELYVNGNSVKKNDPEAVFEILNNLYEIGKSYDSSYESETVKIEDVEKIIEDEQLKKTVEQNFIL